MTKEEKKDEKKNRISMALKDPILQQGFEIICKENAELEQTNNNLLDVINNQDVKIADLEKQIEEYKNGNFVQTVNQIIKGKDKQIEKMKCCGNCKYSNQESVYSIVCKVGGVDKSDYINTDDNQLCDKWEIKEK